MKTGRPAYISVSKRIPFTKSFGSYAKNTSFELAEASLKALVRDAHLEGQAVGDVATGFMMRSGLDWNFGRDVVLGSGLHRETPAYDLARACGSGLEATLQIALKISAGMMDSGIALGLDTNSDLVASFSREMSQKLLTMSKAKNTADKIKAAFRIRPGDFSPRFVGVVEKRTGLSMGEHTEKMVQQWGIGRAEQDQLALESHQKAAAAQAAGFFDDLVVPFSGLKKDSFVRSDTSLEKLAKLSPAFDVTGKGTLTAGNSSPLSDGSAAVLLGSAEYLKSRNLPLRAEFIDAEMAGLDYIAGEGLLMAPAKAVAKLLKRNGLGFKDIAEFEIHEAFAGQVLCTLKAWESERYCRDVLKLDSPLGSVPREKMNVHGGSIAVGHPFGATGARIVGTLAKSLAARPSGSYGLISICTAGGMGVAALLRTP
ncbi:MAG: acetyl-CoA C-acyltransferase [Bdellovibrionaceae bacterium]|nr:acetyl-CoA C-acyltransferase [Pseudobdellovibrionaceae bacterium]